MKASPLLALVASVAATTAQASSSSSSTTTTVVTVLEFGKSGTVRRTTQAAAHPETSVDGVSSFWATLHNGRSSPIQYAGMPVVPDLFRKPESGVVIGISGSVGNLEERTGFSQLYTLEETVGFLEVEGNHCHTLLSSVPEWEDVATVESLTAAAVRHGQTKGFSGVQLTLAEDADVTAVDEQISAIVREFQKLAASASEETTIVVHFVVEEGESESRRRRRTTRRLDEQQAQENVEDDQEQSTYYGYGYYKSNGEYYNPYKSMHQIQYFNVVLWTSLGLVFAMFYAIFLMVYMPLEPDTLLFGESAKLVGDE